MWLRRPSCVADGGSKSLRQMRFEHDCANFPLPKHLGKRSLERASIRVCAVTWLRLVKSSSTVAGGAGCDACTFLSDRNNITVLTALLHVASRLSHICLRVAELNFLESTSPIFLHSASLSPYLPTHEGALSLHSSTISTCSCYVAREPDQSEDFQCPRTEKDELYQETGFPNQRPHQ